MSGHSNGSNLVKKPSLTSRFCLKAVTVEPIFPVLGTDLASTWTSTHAGLDFLLHKIKGACKIQIDGLEPEDVKIMLLQQSESRMFLNYLIPTICNFLYITFQAHLMLVGRLCRLIVLNNRYYFVRENLADPLACEIGMDGLRHKITSPFNVG